MQTARAYLKELGLAGDRGRFSLAAKAMLYKAINEGETFSDWDSDGKIEQPKTEPKRKRQEPSVLKAAVAKNYTPIRKENAIRWTDAEGMSGVMSTCSVNHPISICKCENPAPKDYLNAVKYELIYTEHA